MPIEESSKKLLVYAIDLERKPEDPPQMSFSDVKKACREAIARKFEKMLPDVLENFERLATRSDSDETQRKASERILKEFAEPVQETATGYRGMAVQIINQIPMPEVANVRGKNVPTVEIAGTKVAVGQLIEKKVILPEKRPELARAPTIKYKKDALPQARIVTGVPEKPSSVTRTVTRQAPDPIPPSKKIV